MARLDRPSIKREYSIGVGLILLAHTFATASDTGSSKCAGKPVSVKVFTAVYVP